MKIALIVKPCIRKKTYSRLIPLAEKRLNDAKIGYDLLITQYNGHAVEIIKNMPITEYDGIVSAGGDGTNYHVLNGLLKYHSDDPLPPIGIIPAGRGNSFAMDLDIFTIEDGFHALSRGATRPVDVCKFTQDNEEFYFINLLGFGFVTDVADTASHLRWAGDLSYIIGVLHRTIKLEFYNLEMIIDNQTITGKHCFVEICNSRYTGGNMLMAPNAKIDDGYFDVVVVTPLSRTSLLSTFPKIFKGTHGAHPAVSFYRGQSVTINTTPRKKLLPDGELFGTSPVKIDILPSKVRYFA